MLCQKCGKNEAEVHFTQTLNGETTEAMLCGWCAAESGFGISPISFANFLQGFMDAPQPAHMDTKKDLECGSCGLTLREMKGTGKVGCANCYSAFKSQMETIIKNVQAGSVHTGKYPKKAEYVAVNREMDTLKRRLQEAIELEEYEEAALIRDALRELKEGKASE